MSFPTTKTDGQIITHNGVQYKWVEASKAWIVIPGTGGGSTGGGSGPSPIDLIYGETITAGDPVRLVGGKAMKLVGSVVGGSTTTITETNMTLPNVHYNLMSCILQDNVTVVQVANMQSAPVNIRVGKIQGTDILWGAWTTPFPASNPVCFSIVPFSANQFIITVSTHTFGNNRDTTTVYGDPYSYIGTVAPNGVITLSSALKTMGGFGSCHVWDFETTVLGNIVVFWARWTNSPTSGGIWAYRYKVTGTGASATWSGNQGGGSVPPPISMAPDPATVGACLSVTHTRVSGTSERYMVCQAQGQNGSNNHGNYICEVEFNNATNSFTSSPVIAWALIWGGGSTDIAQSGQIIKLNDISNTTDTYVMMCMTDPNSANGPSFIPYKVSGSTMTSVGNWVTGTGWLSGQGVQGIRKTDLVQFAPGKLLCQWRNGNTNAGYTVMGYTAGGAIHISSGAYTTGLTNDSNLANMYPFKQSLISNGNGLAWMTRRTGSTTGVVKNFTLGTIPVTYEASYFGIAQESGVNGDTKKVAVPGMTSSKHTGLIPGSDYYIQPNGTIGATQTPYPVGKALTATSLNLLNGILFGSTTQMTYEARYLKDGAALGIGSGVQIDAAGQVVTYAGGDNRVIVNPDGSITLNGKVYFNIVNVPSTVSSPGNKGEVAYDGSYWYVCVATNTWRRTQLGTW